MAQRLRYPPLVEALLEVRWGLQKAPDGLATDPAYPTIVGVLYDRLRETYPVIEPLVVGRLVPAELAPHMPTHRFRVGQGAWPLVQIGLGVATINYTQAYTWAAFQTAATDLMRHLGEAYETAAGQQQSPQQITLRYINARPVRPEDGDLVAWLAHRLHVGISLPEAIITTPGLAASAKALRLEVSYGLEQPAGTITLIAGQGQKDGQPAMVWDLMVRSSELETPTLGALGPWLEAAHAVIERWFFGLVEGELLAEFAAEDRRAEEE